jgi:hypothetical protein
MMLFGPAVGRGGCGEERRERRGERGEERECGRR